MMTFFMGNSSSVFECFADLGQVACDFQLLRTVLFAFSASDAVRCFACGGGQGIVNMLHLPVLTGVAGIVVVESEIFGDGDGNVDRAGGSTPHLTKNLP